VVYRLESGFAGFQAHLILFWIDEDVEIQKEIANNQHLEVVRLFEDPV